MTWVARSAATTGTGRSGVVPERARTSAKPPAPMTPQGTSSHQAEIPPRPEGDEPDGSRDPGGGHEPRSSSTGARVPVGSGRLARAEAPFEPRRGDRDERGEVAAEKDVLAEGRAHGQPCHDGIPHLGQRVPPKRLSEREDTDRRASEQRRVDEGPDRARRPALRPDQREEQDRRAERQEPEAAAEVAQEALPRGERRERRHDPPEEVRGDDPPEPPSRAVGGAVRTLAALDEPGEPGQRDQDGQRPRFRIVIRARRGPENGHRHAEQHGGRGPRRRRGVA